jgi:hypothetical protein
LEKKRKEIVKKKRERGGERREVGKDGERKGGG